MTLTTKRISAVVACYRDALSIAAMHERLTTVLSALTTSYEIIFVNDASPDDAEPRLRALAASDPHVVVVSHSRNFGSQMAFASGMRVATGDAVVLLDGDLQDPPEIIPQFVAKWLEGYDVVYGVRTSRLGESLLRRAGYRMFYRMFRRLADVNIPLDAGDFSLMDRRVVAVLSDMPERDLFLRGLRAWVGFRQIGVPYERAERFAGATTNSYLGNFRWARRGFANFSVKPLEYVTYLAVAVAILSAVAIVGYVIAYFTVPTAPRGFLTLLVAVLFLGSIQLLSLAILGDYLGRIFEEVKRRPRYIVRDVLNDPRPSAGEGASDGHRSDDGTKTTT
jgi:dolichol-phosphate mannosyltransferase